MNYEQWNRAIIRHALAHQPLGAKIFLSVTPDTIEQIGKNNQMIPSAALDSFQEAVRYKVGAAPERDLVSVDALFGAVDGDGLPLGVAFLALSVLAAGDMGDDEISTTAYYRHLRQRLGLKGQNGTPFDKADKFAQLWYYWNQHLRKRGFVVTAFAGEGASTNRDYPVSQSLIRKCDADRLVEQFAQSRSVFGSPLTDDLLLARLQNKRDALTKHLKEALNNCDKSGEYDLAFRTAVKAVHDLFLYEKNRAVRSVVGAATGSGDLSGVLKRSKTNKGGEVFDFVPYYHAEFDSLREQNVTPFVLRDDGLKEALVLDSDSSAFSDVSKQSTCDLALRVTLAEIAQGKKWPVQNGGQITQIVLPEQPFHFLMAAGDGSENYESGERTTPDVPFIILCNEATRKELTQLKESGLLKWNGDSASVPSVPGWFKLMHCLVTKSGWNRLRLASDVFHSLKPVRDAVARLSGGVRVPNESTTYLAGFAPTLCVHGAFDQAKISIREQENDFEVHSQNIACGEPVALPASVGQKEGVYRIEVHALESDTPDKADKAHCLATTYIALAAPAQIKRCATRPVLDGLYTQAQNAQIFGAHIVPAIANVPAVGQGGAV